VRGNRLLKNLKPSNLTESMNAFVGQIGSIIERTAARVWDFEFSELEVHARISGKGGCAQRAVHVAFAPARRPETDV